MDAAGVFISYRREESSGQAGRLYDRLVARYGRDRVFRDIDVVKPGTNFVQRIDDAIRSSRAMVVLIGRDWLDVADESGRRRLDNPRDWVRLELTAALEHGTLVVPVLIGGARMPDEELLPEPLKPLASIQALELSEQRWDYDVGVLQEALDEEAAPAPPPAKPEPEPVGPGLADVGVLQVDSLAEVEKLSAERPLLLVTDRAERGTGEEHALRKFREEILPGLATAAEAKRVQIAWANVGGYLASSDLAKHLRKHGVRYVGCHLVLGGRFVASQKVGSFLSAQEDVIRAGLDLLGQLER